MAVRFVRLGITGFKSFADAISVEILPGLTGIVGPNGCGKSNVAEALRWAMGEANVRNLRGGEMDDVIFAGTANRPSRNLAEVSLQIEGEEGDLPSPFAAAPELQVVRRIERGAGSAYRVNGRDARARDVQTLFADLASGARSSAMVSQGKVGSLVNARPEERRAVLEEAAGITGLHARRAEAEARLRAAESNLERAEERRALLGRQLHGLHNQAKQAARYRTVAEALLEAEAILLSMQRSRSVADLRQADTALTAAVNASGVAQNEARIAAETAVSAHSAVAPLREAELAERNTLDRAQLALGGIAAEAARAEAALAAALQLRSQLTSDLAHAEAIVKNADAADARLAAEAVALRAESAAHPTRLAAARDEARSASFALQQADETARLAASLSSEAAVTSAALRQALDQAEGRARRAEDAHARLHNERLRALAENVDASQVAEANSAESRANETVLTARTEQDRAETQRANTTALAAVARERFSRSEAGRHKIAAQAAALADVLAVQDNERWTPMVDRLSVPGGLEAALGAALGEELAAADNPGSARHWRELPALSATVLAGQRMADVVKAPAILDRALSSIGLVISESEGEAGQIALLPGQSLVSAAGALWRWDGYTVRAGTPVAAAVRLQQRNRLTLLREQLKGAERDSDAALLERDQRDKAEREAVATEQQARQRRREAEALSEKARIIAQGLRLRAQTAASRLSALDDQLSHLAPELAAALDSRETARGNHEARPEPGLLRAGADQARAAVNTARNRDSAAERALDALQRVDRGRSVRLNTISRERDDRRMQFADLMGRVADLSARVSDAKNESDRLAAVPKQIIRLTSHATAAADEARARFEAASAALQQAERAVAATAGTARAAEHAAFAMRESVVRAEMQRVAASDALHAVEARLADRDNALPPLPSTDDFTVAAEERVRNRLNRLTRERDEMGPVNLRAEIEAAAIDSEIAVILRDREELSTAITKLRGSISHLNREGRDRLSTVFQQVDRHFQALFARMFGGGRAHLALVGSDDPLVAGLEIFAQPPGKKLAALSLLSGGEQALTALSLIFAIFCCKPAPLCVLDEVDAPLDDANVERFCALLTDMVRETGTRFLIVTHHQLTMARMDRLYGVTMQERGVSRLLSVDLSLAQGMAAFMAAE